ncbi:MAG: RluA family pseudouridine synthase, partial [Treponemataceae bacterium]|nr:RluA family pseudouridine synthase [Treponemataceae bacterium]
MNELKITVQNLENPVRLDQYVSKTCPEISRSRLKNGTKSILLNQKESKLSSKVKNDDEIFILWEDPVPKEIEAEDIPLDILYEDDNVCVLNKKQGMVTHPGCGNWKGTLVNALMYHWKIQNFEFNEKDSQKQKAIRKGIVHRLDKDTSGTIITAKNIDTEIYLQEQFAKRRVKKEYILICNGVPKEKEGNVKVNMIRDPKNRKRFTTTSDHERGKFSHTVYKCLCSYGPYSLIRCRLKTGRTH